MADSTDTAQSSQTTSTTDQRPDDVPAPNFWATMLIPGYGYAFNNYQKGIVASQEGTQKRRAYNALQAQYGDVAGDPQSAIQMQEYGQRQITNPIAVQQAQATLEGTKLENTGRAETNQFQAQYHPLQVQQLTESNREQPLKFQSDQQLSAAQVANLRASAAHTNVETQAAQFGLNEQQAGVAGRLVGSLIDVRDKGGDAGAAFDQVAPSLIQQGLMPKQHAAALSQAIHQDPRVLDNLTYALGAGSGGKNGIVMVPDATNPRAMHAVPATALPKAPPGYQNLYDAKTGGIVQQAVAGSAASDKAALVHNQMVDRGVALQQIYGRTSRVPQMVDQAKSLLPQMASNPVVRQVREKIPGTAEFKFDQLWHQISPNLAFEDLRSNRNAGLLGMRFTQAEFMAAANAYGNMNLGQELPAVMDNLTHVREFYTGSVNPTLQMQVQRMGVSVPGAPGGAQFENGKTYTDAKGNKAIYDNGRWKEIP